MQIIDDSFVTILKFLEESGETDCDSLTRKFGFKVNDLLYLNKCGLIDSNKELSNQNFWLSGSGKDYLATYRANLKAEEKEESRWHITKRQGMLGIIIGGIGILASLVMSILALVL